MAVTNDKTENGTDGDLAVEPGDHVVTVTRKRIDLLLIGLGAVFTLVLAIAGGLLMWGATFANDYVSDELAAQNITFPDAAALQEDGRDDLVPYAGEQVDTGADAEAYASYIQGHVQRIGGGQTYAELGGPERAAKAAVTQAAADGAPQAEIDELQATADELTQQRDTVFRGEILRGTLLNAYAWDTVGQIAGIAAIVAFVAAGVVLILVVAGFVHVRRMHA